MDKTASLADSMPSTSTTLIRQLQARHPQAWHEAVTLYGPLVYDWCRREGLQGEDARDVTQDVFRSLSEQVDRFKASETDASFRGWLRTITRWRLADHYRRERNQPYSGGTSLREMIEQQPDLRHDDSASEASMRFPLLKILDQVRSEFSERLWQAFWRTTVDGLSAAEVAQELKCTKAAVYMAKSRVLARLRDLGGPSSPD